MRYGSRKWASVNKSESVRALVHGKIGKVKESRLGTRVGSGQEGLRGTGPIPHVGPSSRLAREGNFPNRASRAQRMVQGRAGTKRRTAGHLYTAERGGRRPRTRRCLFLLGRKSECVSRSRLSKNLRLTLCIIALVFDLQSQATNW